MLNNILKWTAVVFTVTGALATTLCLDPLNIVLLNVGTVLWLIWSLRIRELSLIAVNAALLTIYLWGIVIRA